MTNKYRGDRGRKIRNESVLKIHTQLFQEELLENVGTLVGFQASTGKTVRVTVLWKPFETICCCEDSLYPKNRDITFVLINVQRDATISSLYFILLQCHSTCFGCRPHPSSGVHKTVVTATGTGHMLVQVTQSNGVR